MGQLTLALARGGLEPGKGWDVARKIASQRVSVQGGGEGLKGLRGSLTGVRSGARACRPLLPGDSVSFRSFGKICVFSSYFLLPPPS